MTNRIKDCWEVRKDGDLIGCATPLSAALDLYKDERKLDQKGYITIGPMSIPLQQSES